jgi:hypothetical protein
MPKYVLRANGWVDPDTGQPMPIPQRDGICVPTIRGDIPDYVSPVTGKVVSGRAARRDEMAKHDLVEVPPRPKDKKVVHSKKLAERLGYEWSGLKA